MHVFKKISLWVVTLVLTIALTTMLLAAPITTRLTNRQSIKNWVSSPEVLNGVAEVVPTVLSQTFEGDNEVGLTQISQQVVGVDLNQLADASLTIITPEYITQKLNPVIDGTYDWLEGKTDSPEFSVVLSDKLTALADAVSGPLKSELAKLPDCPKEIAYSSEFNPIDALCVPPGTDINFIVDEFSQQLTASPEMSDVNISSDDIDFDQELLTTGPEVFSVMRNLPYILGGLTLLLSVGFVLLSKSFKRGLSKLSWIFVGNGLLAFVGFWILGNSDLLGTFDFGDGPDAAIMESVMRPLMNIVFSDIASLGKQVGLFVAALGIVIWLANYTHHKISHEQKENSKKPQTTKSPKPPVKNNQDSNYIEKLTKK